MSNVSKIPGIGELSPEEAEAFELLQNLPPEMMDKVFEAVEESGETLSDVEKGLIKMFFDGTVEGTDAISS